jgi:AbrB family looped-hinge helix DNA binding protein
MVVSKVKAIVLKVGTRGRVVIPKKIRDDLKIKDKVRLLIDEKNERLIILPSPYRQVKLSELK